MPNGKKHKRHKMSTHKRKKRLRKDRHKKKKYSKFILTYITQHCSETVLCYVFINSNYKPL